MTKKIFAAAKYNISNKLISSDALSTIRLLQKHGLDGFIVGGGIRDLLLNKKPKDFDIVTNATPEVIRKIFRRNAIIIGRRFKIVHLIFENINPEKLVNNRPIISKNIIEVSTYRSSNHEYNINEHGKVISDNNYGTQEDDALRRDFTINSLYYDPIKEEIIDYHNAMADIKSKTLKLIGKPIKRYTEDPVRVLRAIRLATKLDLKIYRENFTEVKNFLINENKSRLYEEMLKILLSGASILCIEKLKEIDLPRGVFPLFDKLFFKKAIDSFSLKVLEKTDLRLRETSDVSIIFILAGLMWQMINKDYHSRDSLIAAISQIKPYATSVGLTYHTFNLVSELWILQYDFEYPNSKYIAKIIKNSKFRQAWHLFATRYEMNEIDKDTYQWWDKFILANSLDRMQLLDNLKR